MRSVVFLVTLGLLAAVTAQGAAAARIGVAATVVNEVTGTIGGRTDRLKSSDPVYQSQIVATGARSSAQMLFVDQTTFSLGANSRAVLDRFVFDPNRSAASVAFSVTRGAFRCVTGTARPTSYTVKIPVASIGVRGTVFSCTGITLLYAVCTLSEGSIVICPVPGGHVSPQGRPAGNGCTVIDEPGEYRISLNGGSPPVPNGDPDINDGLDNQNGTFQPPPPPPPPPMYDQ